MNQQKLIRIMPTVLLFLLSCTASAVWGKDNPKISTFAYRDVPFGTSQKEVMEKLSIKPESCKPDVTYVGGTTSCTDTLSFSDFSVQETLSFTSETEPRFYAASWEKGDGDKVGRLLFEKCGTSGANSLGCSSMADGTYVGTPERHLSRGFYGDLVSDPCPLPSVVTATYYDLHSGDISVSTIVRNAITFQGGNKQEAYCSVRFNNLRMAKEQLKRNKSLPKKASQSEDSKKF
jgi:hypothetical protein